MKLYQMLRRFLLRWYLNERLARLNAATAYFSDELKGAGAAFAKAKTAHRELEQRLLELNGKKSIFEQVNDE